MVTYKISALNTRYWWKSVTWLHCICPGTSCALLYWKIYLILTTKSWPRHLLCFFPFRCSTTMPSDSCMPWWTCAKNSARCTSSWVPYRTSASCISSETPASTQFPNPQNHDFIFWWNTIYVIMAPKNFIRVKLEIVCGYFKLCL